MSQVCETYERYIVAYACAWYDVCGTEACMLPEENGHQLHRFRSKSLGNEAIHNQHYVGNSRRSDVLQLETPVFARTDIVS